MEKLIRLFTWLVPLSLLVSCNLYAPLTGDSSEEDHLEEARHCLHDGDYDCAIKEYGKLADGSLKQQKLCTVHLSKMGFTLSTLINTVSEQSNKVLGNLANKLGTWTSTKYDSAVLAKEQCGLYAAQSDSGDLGVLLKTISLMSHCANLISKVDQITGVDDDSDAECTTAGAKDGTVTKADIGDSSGAVSSGTPGMCAKDVQACLQDILAISPSQLSSSGLGDIKGAYDAIPAELRTDGALTPAVRQGLRSVIE